MNIKFSALIFRNFACAINGFFLGLKYAGGALSSGLSDTPLPTVRYNVLTL